MTRLRWVVGGIGALATALAALAVFGMELVPVERAVEPLVTALSGLGPQGFVLASVAVAVVGLAVSLLLPGGVRVLADDGAAERFERRLDRPPEGVTHAGLLTGGALDDDVARALAGDGGALAAVREQLRDLAETTIGDRVGDPAAATDLVANGEWTDDRTAAAFLADGTPTASLRSRLRLWLDPERERERRLRRTAAAIDRLADEHPTASVVGTHPEPGADTSSGEQRPDQTRAQDVESGGAAGSDATTGGGGR